MGEKGRRVRGRAEMASQTDVQQAAKAGGYQISGVRGPWDDRVSLELGLYSECDGRLLELF